MVFLPTDDTVLPAASGQERTWSGARRLESGAYLSEIFNSGRDNAPSGPPSGSRPVLSAFSVLDMKAYCYFHNVSEVSN
jgi:hypothetical protein